MKLNQSMELHFSQNPRTPKIVFTTTLALIILAVMSLQYPLSGHLIFIFTKYYPSSSSPSSSPDSLSISPTLGKEDAAAAGGWIKEERESSEKCDIFTGEWVRNEEGPYYTNETCWAIHEHQNCMKYGRPDSEFMKWRWKPDGCHLPIFNPAQFLEIVRGKSMAFVGDSVARNQMQSLICLLSRVAYPEDISQKYTTLTSEADYFKWWHYAEYEFTVAALWSPFLVKASDADPNGHSPNSLMNLYLDEADVSWASRIENFDFVIISAGQWFFRPLVYYQNGHPVGCHSCNLNNMKALSKFYGYRMAFRTAFRTLQRIKKYQGITFLRTFSPSHFENGDWDRGGNCVRTKPFTRQEVKLDGYVMEFYLTQMEELRAAEKQGLTQGLRFSLLDTTEMMLLRPDGHPNHYGHSPHQNRTVNDCVHWCLPGPIDTWNEFLSSLLKTENQRSVMEKLMNPSV